MKMTNIALVVCMVVATTHAQQGAPAITAPASAVENSIGVLHPVELGKLFPQQVYFQGQKATVQMRNSGGVRWPDGKVTMAALVDTSGYSSAIQQKYQAYLITETSIDFGGKQLAAGAYGVGFVDGSFVVMGLGGHDVLSVPAGKDDAMKRPMPLQITTDGAGYRLYGGRSYVVFVEAK